MSAEVAAGPAVPSSLHAPRHGSYAGIVTRGAAFVIDGLLISAAWTVTIFVVQALAQLFDLSDGRIQTLIEGLAAATAGLLLVLFYYLRTIGWATVRDDLRHPGQTLRLMLRPAPGASSVFSRASVSS